MRSLARDLARACGALGHIAALRRLRVGPFHGGAGDSAGQTAAHGGYPARFPGPSAPRRDRAGRHPGAGLDGGGGLRPVARPGDQPGGADGPHSTGGRSRWGIGPRHGGEPRDRAVPAGRWLAEARTAAVAADRGAASRRCGRPTVARAPQPRSRSIHDVDHRGAPYGARFRIRHRQGRYRQPRGPGGAAVRADRQPDRASQDPRQGFPQPARAC